MEKLDYNVQLTVNRTTAQVIKAIADVQCWWAREIDGSAKKQGDQFTARFGKTWGQFIVSACSTECIEWKVSDCYFDLLSDPKEWKDTRIVFRFSTVEGQTVIDITHEGLTPDKECFNDCTNGWNFYFRESLFNYLQKEQGMPGAGIHAWLESDGKVCKGKIYARDQVATEMGGDLLLLDVKQTKVERVLSAYAVRPFNGELGETNGDYYMLLNNEPGLLEQLQKFVGRTSMN